MLPIKEIELVKMIPYWCNYFGEEMQNTALTETLVGFLDDEITHYSSPGFFLGALSRVVVENHPRQFKRIPGVAELRKDYLPMARTLYNNSLPQDLTRLAIGEEQPGTPEQLAPMWDELNKKLGIPKGTE
jgi:hypothetical protein